MAESNLENPALRTMLRPAKPDISGAGLTEARAWRMMLPKVSEQAVSLVATVAGYLTGKTHLDEILTRWEDYPLHILLRGPDEARGLVQIDNALRAGLIEVQTMARVLNSPAPERAGTPIDAALCDHVINAWLDGAAEANQKRNNWRTVRIVKTIRNAKVALDDCDYSSTEVTISMGEGARIGTLRILKPLPVQATAGLIPNGRAPVPKGFMALEADLVAVLYRTKVPLAWLRDLKPGSMLEVPRRALDHVQVETVDGKRLTRARLGCSGDKRAVRILEEDAPDTPFTPSSSGAGFGDLPEASPSGGLPDLPEPEPLAMGGLPDLPEPEPLGDLPDLGNLAPGGLPDIPGLPPLGGDD